MSYSLPSGLTLGMIQISRESTMPLIRGSVRVLAGQLVDQVERHLDREVLARVLAGAEQHLGLALVDADVVGDLDRPQLAALVAGADRGARDQVRVRGDRRVDLRAGLGIVVVAGVGGGEVRLRGRRSHEESGAGRGDGEEADQVRVTLRSSTAASTRLAVAGVGRFDPDPDRLAGERGQVDGRGRPGAVAVARRAELLEDLRRR